MADSITIDMSSFAKFARDLRRAEPLVATNLGRNLKLAGEIVAAQARQNAGFSSRIPQTIKVRRAGATIRVVAGGGSTPHRGEAAAFEHHGQSGTFRHPVFGHRDRKWADQQARPFLRPALLAHRAEAVEAAKRAVHDAAHQAGIRGF